MLRNLLCVSLQNMRAVLIDGRSNMQESSASDPSSTYMHLALKSAVQVMKNKVCLERVDSHLSPQLNNAF
jgi:hypothetical protein